MHRVHNRTQVEWPCTSGKMKKGKKVKTRGEFAPAKNQLFSPAFFHESREIIVMAGLLA